MKAVLIFNFIFCLYSVAMVLRCMYIVWTVGLTAKMKDIHFILAADKWNYKNATKAELIFELLGIGSLLGSTIERILSHWQGFSSANVAGWMMLFLFITAIRVTIKWMKLSDSDLSMFTNKFLRNT